MKRPLLFLLLSAFLLQACGESQLPPNELPKAPVSVPVPAVEPPSEPLAPTLTAPSVPAQYLEMTVGTILTEGDGATLVLVNADKSRGLPIVIGINEAQAIYFRITRESFSRPLTHDLLDTVLSKSDLMVYQVQVDKLEDQVYFGTIKLSQNGKLVDIDSRPSDAIVLAVGHDAPIYVATKVLQDHGEDIPPGMEFEL